MKKIVPILMIMLAFSVVHAMEDSDFIYVVHLYQSGNVLAVDNNFQYPYDLVADSFVQESTTGGYRGEVLDEKNIVLASFEFNVNDGSFAVKAPYFAYAKEIRFYNENSFLFSVSVSDSSFCNADRVCDSDVGENSQNCPSDCRVSSPFDSIFSYIVVGALALVLLFVFVKWHRRIRKIGSAPMPVPQ